MIQLAEVASLNNPQNGRHERNTMKLKQYKVWSGAKEWIVWAESRLKAIEQVAKSEGAVNPEKSARSGYWSATLVKKPFSINA